MPAERTADFDDLPGLLNQALEGGGSEKLENFLTSYSNLPGPRGNLTLIEFFGALVGDLVKSPGPAFPVERLEALLDGWAALEITSAPVNYPREILPACAVSAYGHVAAARPDWWDDETAKLRQAASDPRWRTREIVAAALQKMLAADWSRTVATLDEWFASDDPLVIRAIAAAVAEPPLLKDTGRASDALACQVKAVEWYARLPQARRKQEVAKTLRQGLGYTVSVGVAAAPAEGLPWLKELAASSDLDLEWIARENMKKNRLKKLLAGK